MVAPDPDEKMTRHELARVADIAAAAFREAGWTWTGGHRGADERYAPSAADIALSLASAMRELSESTSEFKAIHSGRFRVERVIDRVDERVTTSLLLELGESAEPLPEGVTPLPYPEPQLTDDDCAVVFDVEDLRHLVTMASATGGWNEFEDDALDKARSMLTAIDARSGAHAPDPVDDTTTELGPLDDITYRSTGRNAYDVIRTRAEGPDTVLATVLFSEGVRGRVHGLEALVRSLRQTVQDVQP